MLKFIFKTTFLALFSILSISAIGQTVERNTFAVFSSITPNDTLLVAGGQIMTGESDSPLLEQGYYPLSNTLLSINEPELIQSYSIYPNPFNASFQVNWTNTEVETITLEIYSVNGSLIQRIESSDAQIIFYSETWEPGMYFVRGFTDQGILFDEKVIKA